MRVAPAYPCSVVLTKNEVTEFLETLDSRQILWRSGHDPVAWNPIEKFPGYTHYRIYFTGQRDRPGMFRMSVTGHIEEPNPFETDVSLEYLGFGLVKETPKPLNLSLIFS